MYYYALPVSLEHNIAVATCVNAQSHANSTVQSHASTTVHVPGGFQNLCGTPIYGGKFEVPIHQNIQNTSPLISEPETKRIRVTDSD